MNKQRKVLITTTYNEMGIIIDTKAEEVAQPLNQDSIETQSSDLISRQAALELCDWYDNPSMREDLEKLRAARFSTDTISRKAAIDALERDIKFVEEEREKAITRPEKYHDRFVEASTQQIMGMAHALQAIEELPSAQPEIIRCKDCKHWDGVDTCDVIDAPVWDNDFCSFEERRSDEE